MYYFRVKGYAPWPAKITKADKRKYSVYFYGTGEISQNLKSTDLYDYVLNRNKFVNEKNLKRKYFKEAVDQIDNIVKGEEDVTSINMAVTLAVADTEQNMLTKEKNSVQTQEKKKERKINSTISNTSVANIQATETVTDLKTSDQISRSGRKIKPKRFLDSEIADSPFLKRKAVPETKAVDAKTKKFSSDYYLKIECSLVELDHLIKASVGLGGAQPEKCIQYLRELQSLDITQIMLKKHPSCVETIKRLRRYVGNVKVWDMDETIRTDFNTKANQIRNEAETIYTGFKKLFNNSVTNSTFWEFFMEEVEKFREKTKNMSKHQLFGLIEEPANEKDPI